MQLGRGAAAANSCRGGAAGGHRAGCHIAWHRSCPSHLCMPLPSPTCARRRHRPRSRSTGASAGHERVLRLCHRAAVFISTCPRPPQAGRRADSRHGRRHGRRRARRDPCRDPSCSIQWRGVRTARDGLPRAAWAARASLGLSSPRVGAPKRPSRPPIRPTRCCRLQEGRREATWPSRLLPSGPSWPPGPPPAAWWSAPRSRRLPWLCPSEWALPQGRIGWRRRRAGRLCRPPAAAHPRTFAAPSLCVLLQGAARGGEACPADGRLQPAAGAALARRGRQDLR